jgi:hypothetical protein
MLMSLEFSEHNLTVHSYEPSHPVNFAPSRPEFSLRLTP